MTRRPIALTQHFPRVLAFGFFTLALLTGPTSSANHEASPLRVQTEAQGDTIAKSKYRHWSITPQIAEQEFSSGEMKIVSERYAGRGVSGARVLEIDLVKSDRRIRAKWKPLAKSLDRFNNSPRKEIATYEIQKFFLDSKNYVVPTSGIRCLQSAEFIENKRHDSETLPETNCELGLLSLWLEEVTLPDPLLDKERFAQDPVYARHLADFNLLTYLVKHLDGRTGNILVAVNENDRRVFAIDNGVAFGGFWFNWFVPNWNKIRVPAMRRESIARLRQLTIADLQPLGVLAQLEWAKGVGVWGVSPTANFDPEETVRRRGHMIQLGLDDDEIENIWKRIEHLLEDVDGGKIKLF